MANTTDWMDLLGGGTLLRKETVDDDDDEATTATTQGVVVRPADGQRVTVRLVGRVLLNPNHTTGPLDEKVQLDHLQTMHPGSVFHPQGEMTFCVGENEVPTGLDLGIRLSQAGDRFTLRMVSRLGYGKFGLPSPPTNIISKWLVEPHQPLEYGVEIVSLDALKVPVDTMTVDMCLQTANHKSALGTRAFKRGDYELATTLYGRALVFVQPTRDQTTTEMLDAYVRVGTNLATSFAKTKRSDKEIIKLTTSVTSVNDQVPKAWYQMGCAYRRMLEFKVAIDCMNKVLILDPTSVAAKKELEKIHKKVRDYKKKEKKMYLNGISKMVKEREEEEERLKTQNTQLPKDTETIATSTGLQQRHQHQHQHQNAQNEFGKVSRASLGEQLRGAGEEDRDWQPHSEVCKRGTSVAKMVGAVMALVLLVLTVVHWHWHWHEKN